MSLWSYSPDDIDILIGGAYRVEGLAEGTFVKITKDLPTNQTFRAADGTVARKAVIGGTYTVELTLLCGSPANSVLNAFSALDEATGYGKFPLLIKDNSGNSYFFSPLSWIEIQPPLEFSTSAITNTWVFKAAEGTRRIGGNDKNSDITTLVETALASLPFAKQVLTRLGL